MVLVYVVRNNRFGWIKQSMIIPILFQKYCASWLYMDNEYFPTIVIRIAKPLIGFNWIIYEWHLNMLDLYTLECRKLSGKLFIACHMISATRNLCNDCPCSVLTQIRDEKLWNWNFITAGRVVGTIFSLLWLINSFSSQK